MNIVKIDRYNIPLRYLAEIYNKFPDVYNLLFSTDDRYIEIDLDSNPILKTIYKKED